MELLGKIQSGIVEIVLTQWPTEDERAMLMRSITSSESADSSSAKRERRRFLGARHTLTRAPNPVAKQRQRIDRANRLTCSGLAQGCDTVIAIA
jgi:hypothetical protein